MTSLLPLVVVAVVLLVPILVYNRLVALRHRLRRGFRQVCAQLRLRYDVVPHLVEVAKPHLAHDRATLEAVIVARNEAQQAERKAVARPEDGAAIAAVIDAERTLSEAIEHLIAASEAFPALAADADLQQLRRELAANESRFAYARRSYNRAVTLYNTYRRRAPASQIAAAFGFRAALPFETGAEAREASAVAAER